MIKEEFVIQSEDLYPAICPSCGSFRFELSLEEGEMHGYCPECDRGFRIEISVTGILDMDDEDYWVKISPGKWERSDE